MSLTKLIISCGGTGGHFFPGLSIARRFKERGGDVLLLISGAMVYEQRAIAENAGIKAVALPVMPNYRKNPFRFICGAMGGFFASIREIRNFSPQAVLSMGSFTSLPVLSAAIICRIPRFLHDGNARVGKANRLFSRFARFMGTAFPAVNDSSCRCHAEETGMPLRPELLEFTGLDKSAAIEKVNREFCTSFVSELPLILVTGGSQGAAVFNTVMPEAFKRSVGDFQVIHLAGKGKLEETEKNYQGAEFKRLLLESTGLMAEIFAASDLVFSRSGGSTVAELSLFGKASVLVPYPYASERHQLDNAKHFFSNNSAILVENHEMNSARASAVIEEFLRCPEKFRKMGERMKKLSHPEASDEMIDKISCYLN